MLLPCYTALVRQGFKRRAFAESNKLINYAHVFGRIAFSREDTTMACYYARANPDFCTNLARCLNLSRVSFASKSIPIAIKFCTAVASLMAAQYTFVFFFKHEYYEGSIKPHLAKIISPGKFYLFCGRNRVGRLRGRN